nr:unnamed protein product [Digitaria exilis]
MTREQKDWASRIRLSVLGALEVDDLIAKNRGRGRKGKNAGGFPPSACWAREACRLLPAAVFRARASSGQPIGVVRRGAGLHISASRPHLLQRLKHAATPLQQQPNPASTFRQARDLLPFPPAPAPIWPPAGPQDQPASSLEHI